MPDRRPHPARVVLCDDAIGFPELVAAWCAASAEVELVGRATSETELLASLPRTGADVVLLDFMLPEGPTDRHRVARIRDVAPGARVVLVSSLPPMQLQDEAERVGADAWCPKATTADRLLAAALG